MITYNTKEEAKAVLRNKELPFGASIILNTKDGDLLGVQGKSKIKFLDMNTLPPTNGKSNQVLKLDENGNVVWANDDMRDIVDDLTSTDTDKALSANMGKYLQDNKLDNALIEKKSFITSHVLEIKDNALNITSGYIIYNKTNNSFSSKSISTVFPVASSNTTGVMSVDHYNLLNLIDTDFNTNTTGLVANLTGFTYTTEVVRHNSSVIFKSGNTWTKQSKTHSINPATTTTAGVMTAADKTKLDNTVSATTEATPDTLGLVKQAAELTNLEADNDLAGVIAHFNQLLANLKEAGIMYATPAGS
nr:MAG: hypothetical protein [Bacteriophage sp.]